METKQRWQDSFTLVITLVIGAWLFVAPFVMGFTHGLASWNSYASGIVVMVLSVYGLATKQIWEEWINMGIGIWLFFSPMVLGYYDDHALRLHFMNTGAVLFFFSLWASMLYQVGIPSEFSHEEHGHKA
jgi:SPW repeat